MDISNDLPKMNRLQLNYNNLWKDITTIKDLQRFNVSLPQDLIKSVNHYFN